MDENIREQPNYTLPGVLHFIKHEWSRFEVERANWDVERTELQVSRESFVRKYEYSFFVNMSSKK